MPDIWDKMDADEKSSKGEAAKEFVPGPAWLAAEAAGIDMSLIELNLAKTPWERMKDHDRVLVEAKLLREAMQKGQGILEGLLERFCTAKAEFVVVGEYAAFAHGASHVTGIIEVCMEFSPENVARLEEALEGLHPQYRKPPQKLPFESTSLSIGDIKNLYLSTDLGVLDCLSEVLGIGDYEAVKAQSIEVSLPGGSCRILNIPALIRAKEAMGRPHDLLTITQLKAILEREG